MRRRRNDLAKFTVRKSYDRLRREWQSSVDGTAASSASQPIAEDAAMSAQRKMVEHRETVKLAKKKTLP